MQGEDSKHPETWRINRQNAHAQSTGQPKAAKSSGPPDFPKAAKDIVRQITRPVTEGVNDDGWCSTSTALNILIVLAIIIIAILVYIFFFHNSGRSIKHVSFA